MRLKGVGGLRYNAEDAGLSDVDLRVNVVHVTAKGQHEMVLSTGKKTPATSTGKSAYTRPALAQTTLRLAVARHQGLTHAKRYLPDDQGSRQRGRG